MSGTKLLPCPFGCKGYVYRRMSGRRLGFIECMECGATGPEKHSSHEAEEAWNCRPTPIDSKVDWVKWKSGDALPAHCFYVATRHDEHRGEEIVGITLSSEFDDANVIAYLPIFLPAPYTEESK